MTHGSFNNLLYANTITDEPEVGDGATEIQWTDRTPYTVIDVIHGPKGKVTVIVQQDKVVWKPWPNGYAETITPDPNGYHVTVTRKKNGKWVGDNGSIFNFGHRSAYHDPSF